MPLRGIYIDERSGEMDWVEVSREITYENEQEWFASNIRQIESSLYRLAFSILKNIPDSEDALSEAILKAYKYRNKLKDSQAFKAWVSKILVREAYKVLKKNKRIMSVPLEEYEEIGVNDGLQGELMEVIKTLPADLATVLILYYYDQYTVKEIAHIVEVREGTVKSRLYRGREELKQHLLAEGGNL